MEMFNQPPAGPGDLEFQPTQSQELKWWGDNRPGPTITPSLKTRLSRYSVPESVVERGNWASRTEFMLSCIGLSVGLGNVWRFPYLAYENGGGVFLFAYFVLQILLGKPMYFLELAVGQFSGKGPTRIWDLSPSAKGIGLSMCMLTLVAAIYYNVIMAYTLYYVFATVQGTPWVQCLDKWVKENNCVPKRVKYPKLCTENVAAMEVLGSCTCTGNTSLDSALSFPCISRGDDATTAAELYFYKTVLQRSSGLEFDQIGTPIPALVLCLFLCWLVVVICLIQGIKSSGKVVYLTATLPFVIMFALLIRGCFLDGAGEGVLFFLLPKWERLLDLNVWAMAASQVFISLSVSYGGIIMFGSYNKFYYTQVYRDAIIISTLDLVTSLLGGLVVFTTIGAMAHKIGTSVGKVAQRGYGLAFIIYPEALSNMPHAQLWSTAFFLMLFTLGLDTEFAFLETLLTCIQDEFPYLRYYKGRLCIGVGLACFLIALPCVCPGGDYVVLVMVEYGADMPILVVSYVELTTIMFVYGYGRFLQDIEYMLGGRPRGWQYLLICWTFFAPFILTSLIAFRLFNHEQPRYPDGRPYPIYAQVMGWAVTMAVLAPMPLWLAYMVKKSYSEEGLESKADRKEFLFAPNIHWKPNDNRPHPVLLRGTGEYTA